ncbi:hypothetical protein [Staphylococcus warneri]|uniref:hypothetical protein n=1 Tax=Staphylococcus warneri TaxID=1292 RepID=UPI0034CFB814
MSGIEFPKPPHERGYNEGRFVGWMRVRGVLRPVYEETPMGCCLGALGTFVFFMVCMFIMAAHGDSEMAQVLDNFGGLIVDFIIKPLRIIFIPIYLVISVIICMYGYLFFIHLFPAIHKKILKDKLETLPWLLSYVGVAFLIYLLVKFALFIHLI